MRDHNGRVFGPWLINKELLRAGLWPMFNFYDGRWMGVGDSEYLRAEVVRGQERFREWWMRRMAWDHVEKKWKKRSVPDHTEQETKELFPEERGALSSAHLPQMSHPRHNFLILPS